MLTKLYLMRHGETDWNKNSIFQGQTDIDLNKKGIEEAKKTAQVFDDLKLDFIYSSDLIRTKKTALFIARPKKMKINESKKIREISFGDWEGLNYKEIEEKFPDNLAKWRDDPLNNNPIGGEKLLNFKARIKNFFQEILTKNQGKKILVVTHGGVIKMYLTIVLAMKSKDFWKFQIDNCSITELKFYDNDPILR
jgi:alpha-ribazole phosphatase